MQEFDFDSENDIVDESQLSEPEAAAAAMLGINTKRLSKKAYAELKQKAEEMVSQASAPSTTPRQAAKGIVKGGGKKSAEVSARTFQKALEKGPIKVPSGPTISDLPQISGKMGAAIERAKSAAAGAPWSPTEGVISDLPFPSTDSRMPLGSEKNVIKQAEEAIRQKIQQASLPSSVSKEAVEAVGDGIPESVLGKAETAASKELPGLASKTPFLQKIASLAATTAGKRALAGISGIGYLSALYGDEGPGPEPTDPYLNPPKKVNYTPSSTEKSDLNSPMSSSKYDSLGEIISDINRPKTPFYPTPTGAPIPDNNEDLENEEAKRVLAASPRTVSAGEPSVADVKKQQELSQLQGLISKSSEYEDLMTRFREAQERERNMRLMAGLGRASEQIGAAIAGVKPGDGAAYKAIEEYAGQQIPGVEKEEAFKEKSEELDPNSEISKQYQDMARMLGINITGKESARVLKEKLPMLERFRTAEENREARKQAAQIQRETLASNRALLQDEKANKEFVQMSQKINSETASSRSAFGRGANIIRSAEAIETLAKGLDPKDIDSRQITEIARNLDAMLSQGAATISGTKKLIPSSFTGDIAKISEYITSRPKGAGQQDFVKRMLETVAREKELAKDQVVRTQKKILSGYSHLKEKYPQRYNEILEEYGIPSEESRPSLKVEEQKVIVEKDGKQYKLPKSQLSRAIAQGYKEVQ